MSAAAGGAPTGCYPTAGVTAADRRSRWWLPGSPPAEQGGHLVAQ